MTRLICCLMSLMISCFHYRVELHKTELHTVGTAHLAPLHSCFEYGAPAPIMIYPQLPCDALTVVEFGELFFADSQQRESHNASTISCWIRQALMSWRGLSS